MAGTKHVVDIYLTGVSPSLVAANPQDTVQWSCPSGPSGSVDVGFATGANITFTGSNPFASGVDGTISITNNGTSSTYAISNKAKGTYTYKAVTLYEGASHETYTASIQVTDDTIIDTGDGGVIEVPMPTIPGDSES
jgi:hypothetical protein